MDLIKIVFLLFVISGTFATKKFPDNFKFGASGASYQIEGAWNEDGKGPSIWDTFVHVPGNTEDGRTGSIACDSYHKYKEDIQILANLNATIYRFSISWPRVLPNGTPNKINQAGLDYYINLELKANGIEPLVTIYHWDLPQYLEDMGGWLNPQIAHYFGDFARIMYKNLGPYVKYWVTLNEPYVFCTYGYGKVGLFANPIFLGNWPQIVIDRVANRSRLEGYSFSRLPEFTQEEIDYINGTFDYFTLNTYSSYLVEYTDEWPITTPSYMADQGVITSYDPSWPRSAVRWLRREPKGIRLLLNWIDEKYNPGEIIITENGWPDNDGSDDQGRIAYYKGYLSNILDAILEDGINVTAYTLWSLLDNFGWNGGYKTQYGIVHVDFNSPNRTRTLKSSAEWYKRLIAARAIVD